MIFKNVFLLEHLFMFPDLTFPYSHVSNVEVILQKDEEVRHFQTELTLILF